METLYHGTNSRFKEFSQNMARIPNDFYGGGVAYFTDNLKVAATYAKAAVKEKGGTPLIYKVKLNVKKLFDVDDDFKGKAILKFVDNEEEFVKAAKLARLGGDDVIGATIKLENGRYDLTGDQIFKGISRGMVNTAKAREKLKKMGYTTLRYNGGVNMNAKKHNVYLVYYARDITIEKRYKVTK
jgi:hypothetical protein